MLIVSGACLFGRDVLDDTSRVVGHFEICNDSALGSEWQRSRRRERMRCVDLTLRCPSAWDSVMARAAEIWGNLWLKDEYYILNKKAANLPGMSAAGGEAARKIKVDTLCAGPLNHGVALQSGAGRLAIRVRMQSSVWGRWVQISRWMEMSIEGLANGRFTLIFCRASVYPSRHRSRTKYLAELHGALHGAFCLPELGTCIRNLLRSTPRKAILCLRITNVPWP